MNSLLQKHPVLDPIALARYVAAKCVGGGFSPEVSSVGFMQVRNHKLASVAVDSAAFTGKADSYTVHATGEYFERVGLLNTETMVYSLEP